MRHSFKAWWARIAKTRIDTVVQSQQQREYYQSSGYTHTTKQGGFIKILEGT